MAATFLEDDREVVLDAGSSDLDVSDAVLPLYFHLNEFHDKVRLKGSHVQTHTLDLTRSELVLP